MERVIVRGFKKIIFISLIMSLILMAMSLPQSFNDDQKQNKVVMNSVHKTSEWIIKWDGDYSKNILSTATILNWLPDLHITRVKLHGNVSQKKWLQEWSKNPAIKYIQPNYVYSMAQAPNDTHYPNQNYLKQIHAEKGWDQFTDSNVTIAILDTGVDLEHPDLKANLVKGINLQDKDKSPQDDNGHGTNIAGIVAAVGNNFIGIAGVTWKVKIMPIKVLQADGKGDSFIVGLGIRYAVDHGAKIVLLSAGEPIFTPFMSEAVNYAGKNDVLIVAASGNEGSQINYPAAFHNVLSVGAVNSLDKYVSYSNYGQQLDVVAPGEAIYTTALGGDYTINSGTSMAAPQVAGLAALLFQKYPDMSAREVAEMIKFTTDDVEKPGWDVKTGYGRINVEKALDTTKYILLDGYEPNNVSQNAHIFPLEDVLHAQLIKNDVDWYKINLPYNGKVNLNLNLDQTLEYGVNIDFFSPDKLPDILPDGIRTLPNIGADNQQQNNNDTINTPMPHNSSSNTNNNLNNISNSQDNDNQDSNNQLSDGGQSSNTNLPNDSTAQDNKETNGNTDNNNLDNQDQTDIAPKVEPIQSYTVTKEQSIIIDLPKGYTYIRVYLSDEQKASTVNDVNYMISNHYTIYTDAYESNNNPWNAYQVNNPNEDIVGTFDKNDDEDWFKVNVNQSGTLSVKVSVDTTRLDPILYIQQLNGKEVKYDYQESGKAEQGYSYVEPGVYYIKVSDYNKHEVNGEYHLSIHYDTNDGDSYEPNDISTHATHLKLTEKIYKASIAGVNDSDWYVFQLDEPEYIAMDFSAINPIEIALYDTNLNIIKYMTIKDWNKGEKFEAGKYYFRITSKQKASYSFQVMKFVLYGNFIDINNSPVKDNILKLYNEKLINGFDDYTFRPELMLTREELAFALNKELNLPRGKRVDFQDVSKEDSNYVAINNVVNAGLMKVVEANSFEPKHSISRDELVKILANAYHIPVIHGLDQKYPDVGVDDIAYNEINTFSTYNLLAYYADGVFFKPKEQVTREEFVALFDKVRNFDISKDVLQGIDNLNNN